LDLFRRLCRAAWLVSFLRLRDVDVLREFRQVVPHALQNNKNNGNLAWQDHENTSTYKQPHSKVSCQCLVQSIVLATKILCNEHVACRNFRLHPGDRDAPKYSTTLLQGWHECLLIDTKHFSADPILPEYKVHPWNPDLATCGEKDKGLVAPWDERNTNCRGTLSNRRLLSFLTQATFASSQFDRTDKTCLQSEARLRAQAAQPSVAALMPEGVAKA
jgi:hypothetical protein